MYGEIFYSGHMALLQLQWRSVLNTVQLQPLEQLQNHEKMLKTGSSS